MKIWRQASRLTLILALGATGCSRQLAVPGPTAGSGAGSGQLPFDRVSDSAGVSPTDSFVPDGVPAGTEVTIRLGAPLSSADARAGDSFEAMLDESVIVSGKLVAARGVPVTGSIVDSRGSASSNPGYLRMTLVSITLNGKPIRLETSSIFTKGGSYQKRRAANLNIPPDGRGSEPESLAESAGESAMSSAASGGDVRFSTGHRFTFRVIQPFHP